MPISNPFEDDTDSAGNTAEVLPLPEPPDTPFPPETPADEHDAPAPSPQSELEPDEELPPDPDDVTPGVIVVQGRRCKAPTGTRYEGMDEWGRFTSARGGKPRFPPPADSAYEYWPDDCAYAYHHAYGHGLCPCCGEREGGIAITPTDGFVPGRTGYGA
jgi:hypothetical protein